MNKLVAIGLICLVLISSCSAAQKNSRRGANVAVDDDEFSEFDDEFEKPATKSPEAAQRRAAVTQPPTPSTNEDDFESDDDFNVNSATPKQDATKKAPTDQKKPSSQQQQQQTKSADFNADELDLEEFDNFADDDEFDSSASSTSSPYESADAKKSGKDSKAMPSLKIADVPLHLMSTGNWQNYVWEICMLAIIAAYMINFLIGKSKNYQLVNHWYQTHRALLEKNFAVVGDDGMSQDLPKPESTEENGETASTESSSSGSLIKDSENSYGLWCTGRHGCEGMLIQLKLIKRQDLINGTLMQLVKPQCDQIVVSVEFAQQDDLDSFVFCLANRKCSAQLFSDYQDVATYCIEKKLGTGASIVDAKYTELLATQVASKYVMLNEIGEVPNNVLDKTVCAFLNKYPDMVEYLIISDQYVGYKSVSGEEPASANQASSSPSSATPGAEGSLSTGIPKSRSILILCLNVGGRGLSGATAEDMESMQPALQLAMYLADKAPHIRISKEAKAKAQRKRKEVAEQYLKISHKQRQEAAMQRKEEKRRAEKEKIMNESDPEKQKKLEAKELKREKKKSLSKMKQIKIKSM